MLIWSQENALEIVVCRKAAIACMSHSVKSLNYRLSTLLFLRCRFRGFEFLALSLHYSDVITGAMASQITSLLTQPFIQAQIKENIKAPRHWGIHRWPVNSPHEWPVMRKVFPFDDVIMKNWIYQSCCSSRCHDDCTPHKTRITRRCVGWYGIIILSCMVSNVYFSCTVQDSMYHNMDINTIQCKEICFLVCAVLVLGVIMCTFH